MRKKTWRRLTAAVMTGVLTLAALSAPTGSVTVRAEGAEAEAEGAETEEKAVKLPDGTVSYTSQYRECRQIPNEAQQGIYFLNNEELSFYSFASGETEPVCTFENIGDSYTSGGKLYVTRTFDKKVEIFDLDTKQPEKTIDLDFTPECVGVDGQGRIYLSAYGSYDEASGTSRYLIYLLNGEGQILSQTEAPGEIYDFGGFDSANGNFYFECYYNWLYWGYEHDMTVLEAGNVAVDGQIALSKTFPQLISQRYYNNKQRAIALLAGRYVCVDSPVYSSLYIWDSSKCDVAAATFEELAELERVNGEDTKESVGPRCVYKEESNSIVTVTEPDQLEEYSIETKAFVGAYRTEHPVFSLESYGDKIVVIEREGDDFYLETLQWNHSEKLEITGGSAAMKAGERMQLQAVSDGMLKETFTWSSSDPKVVSVTNDGTVFAWHEGTADVTVSGSSGLSATWTVTVEPRAEAEAYPEKLAIEGTVIRNENASENNYSVWSQVVNSYLSDNGDGTLMRVENTGTNVLVEMFDKKTGAIIESRTILAAEEFAGAASPVFGGFYCGAEHNYLVFGQSNLTDSEETEVLDIVQYSKDWERLASVTVKGANTHIPFDGGSLRMTETAGKLYLYTCHEMFTSEDGLNHQANMTFVVNESTMEIEDSYYDVMNIAQAGYVSHSFNQFIRTDGEFIYRVDHGDAYPRAVSITKCAVGDSVQNVDYTLPYAIDGMTGNNATGVSVGGLELSSDSCLIAGNSVKQDGDNTDVYGQRNLFLTVTDKEFSGTDVVWITRYTGGGVEVRTPQLVKIGEDQFLLLWEERNVSSGKIATCMATVDGYGNRTSEIRKTDMRLSDCQPIVCTDGLVRWYVVDGGKMTLYTVDPLGLPAITEFRKGDVDKNGSITSTDALQILKYLAKMSVLDEEAKRLADTDGSDGVTSSDALQILRYLANYIEL